MPSYQYQTAIPKLVNAGSQSNSQCAKSNKGSLLRQVPDVSTDADPESGYTGGLYPAGTGFDEATGLGVR